MFKNLPKFVFFTGKGGVGKTSLASATALSLVDTGKQVLLVRTDPASNVGQVFEIEIGNRIRSIPSVVGLDAIEINPEEAAAQYRQFNRRFLQMCSHYLIEPTACTSASGWEKGQVENQVGLVRERFFTPRLRVKSYEELNGILLDRCIAYAKAHKHPEMTARTIWEMFEDERAKLVPVRHRFDGFHATTASVSRTCLVRFDNNKYSVASKAVGRPAEIFAYADRIVVKQDGVVVAEHARCFGRGETVFNPWHYVPVLARKPGALRNGAPFRDWALPSGLDRVWRKLRGSDDGDRQMVKILSAVLTDGLLPVDAACAEALANGVHSADVIINILARKKDLAPVRTIMTPDALRLQHEPVANCHRYDSLRSVIHGTQRPVRHDGRVEALRHEECL